MATRKRKPAVRGSGSPSAQYLAERYARLDLKIDPAAAELLRVESERSGWSMAQLVEEMIRIELDTTHEGYVGPRERVRCAGYVNRVRCGNVATVAATGLCERCQLVRDDEALDRSDDDGPDDELSARLHTPG